MLQTFQPRFWELVGLFVSVAGLLAGGSVVVTLNPSGWQVAALVGAAGLLLSGGFFARALWFNRAFPFYNVEHDVLLRITKTAGEDGLPSLQAKLVRTTRFSARFRNLRYFDRFQLVPDTPNSAASLVLQGMNHSFEAKVLQPGTSKEWVPVKNVACNPSFKAERELTLLYDFQQDMKARGNRFEITEELDLPNDFTSPEEWYTFKVSEPAKNRKFTFEFEGISINSARFFVKHGTNEGPVKTIPVSRQLGNQPRSSFSQEVKSATVGAVINFRWDWDGLN